MNLRHWICHLLSFLRVHRAGCENCNPGGSLSGENMRKRLEELLENPLTRKTVKKL
jgi:hypothetical protein